MMRSGRESSENIVNRIKIFSREEHLACLDSFVKERYVNYSKHIKTGYKRM
jgi:hypothetical protein